jgi:hypothetical protein
MEGLLGRVIAEPAAQAGDHVDGDGGTDVDRTRTLFESAYRLDSASDRGFDWKRNNSVRALAKNYQSVLFRLAVAAGQAGDQASMRSAFRRGIELATFHGDTETATAMQVYWASLDPGNPEVRAQASGPDQRP